MQTTKLLEFWRTNSDLWFNSTEKTDSIIYKRFADYKIDETNKAEVIIWYDQIQRHICRFKKLEYPRAYLEISVEAGLELLSQTCQQTRHISPNANLDTRVKKLIKRLKGFKNIYQGYPPEIAMFCMMCFKHLYSKKALLAVKDLALQLYLLDGSPVYLRFWKDTIEKLSKKITASLSTVHPSSFTIYPYSCFTYNSTKPIYTKLPNRTQFPQVLKLEHTPYKYKNIRSVIVSFSGGVDSTTALSIFTNSNIKVEAAVYIQHFNCSKSESQIELELIRYICDLMKCPLYVRRIVEFTRDTIKTEREFYELITKKIRFAAYRQIADLHNTNYVVIAHHKGDSSENIIRNVERSIYFNNLKGSEEFREMYQVIIWRPFLNFSKYDFYLYCMLWNLPHVKNSTPSWCHRGIIRSDVLREYPIDMSYTTGDIIKNAIRFYQSTRNAERLDNVLSELAEHYTIMYEELSHVDNKIQTTTDETKTTIEAILYQRNVVFLNILNDKLDIKLSPKTITNIVKNPTQNKFSIDAKKQIELYYDDQILKVRIILLN